MATANKEVYDDQNLASHWNFKFKDAMVHKAEYTKRWKTYQDAYNGDYFKNENRPEYKSDYAANYVFSIIETIRPIMVDNNPKFQAMPRTPDGMKFSNDLQQAFLSEWDREDMTRKLYQELIPTLVIGTSVWFTPWDSEKKNVKSIPVNAFNIFPDPLATSITDAEYIIYASYRHVERLKRLFPDKEDKLVGGDVNYSELVHDNDKNAHIDNQVLVIEVWTRDYDSYNIDSEKQTKTRKYPKGRVITLCPELGIVLEDKGMPYDDGLFPFELLKDYDIAGKFWGEGEVAQLLSPQKYMNELNNAILDNAKATANMPWIIDKNSGIGVGKITNRPGLVIRKNAGAEVKREQPPNMPNYVINAVETYKQDLEQISGVFNSVKGGSQTGVYTAQGVLALQEAGQARIRLKVKLMEVSLANIAMMWYSRMKQFWKDDRWVRTIKPDGSYDFKNFTSKKILAEEFDIRILTGSTMPVNRGAMLDLMIRLAQTQMPDGQMLVDREAVVEYLPSEVKASIIERMEEKATAIDQQIQQLVETSEQITQALEQITQESTQNDDQTFDVIDELTSALEEVNKKIVQLEEDNDTMKREKAEEEKITQIQDNSYNEGYQDAEKLGDSQTTSTPKQKTEPSIGEGMGEGIEGMDSLPEDILEGLEDLSDEELETLMALNPELEELLR